MGDHPRVRLAELVGALSLGIDLGFGQPVELVLRQCLIGLRLAERLGLDDGQRAVVYYTTLLVNVGCHTDAHEQAKWFGDDLVLKAGEYAYGLRSLRGQVLGIRRMGAGRPSLQRVRTAFDFALGGYREIDGMAEQHARFSSEFARESRLPEAVGDGARSIIRVLRLTARELTARATRSTWSAASGSSRRSRGGSRRTSGNSPVPLRGLPQSAECPVRPRPVR